MDFDANQHMAMDETVAYISDSRILEFSRPEQVLKEGMDYQAKIETTKGTIEIDLFEQATPETVNSFVFLALNHFYEGVPFHRVIPGFMAQTGDPTGTGTGGPGYAFGLEIRPDLRFDKKGVLGMARSASPNSNGSQFFITFDSTPHLNDQYTVFGQVRSGLEVLDSISPTEPARPDSLDRITRVIIKAQPR